MSNATNQTKKSKEIHRRIGPDESLISLGEAAKLLPKVNGKKPAICTLWRWCRKGLRGVSLEYIRVGRKICTSHEAMLRFFADLADLDEQVEPDRYVKPASLNRRPITSRQRQRALAKTDAFLQEAGI